MLSQILTVYSFSVAKKFCPKTDQSALRAGYRRTFDRSLSSCLQRWGSGSPANRIRQASTDQTNAFEQGLNSDVLPSRDLNWSRNHFCSSNSWSRSSTSHSRLPLHRNWVQAPIYEVAAEAYIRLQLFGDAETCLLVYSLGSTEASISRTLRTLQPCGVINDLHSMGGTSSTSAWSSPAWCRTQNSVPKRRTQNEQYTVPNQPTQRPAPLPNSRDFEPTRRLAVIQDNSSVDGASKPLRKMGRQMASHDFESLKAWGRKSSSLQAKLPSPSLRA